VSHFFPPTLDGAAVGTNAVMTHQALHTVVSNRILAPLLTVGGPRSDRRIQAYTRKGNATALSSPRLAFPPTTIVGRSEDSPFYVHQRSTTHYNSARSAHFPLQRITCSLHQTITRSPSRRRTDPFASVCVSLTFLRGDEPDRPSESFNIFYDLQT